MRTEKSIKNVTIALIGQGLYYIFSFILRTIFIKTLGNEYLGINGLFTNILYVISIVELGFGATIIVFLYKPIAEKNIEKIAQLENFYSNIYRKIGVLIFVIAMLVIPFLSVLANDVSEKVKNQLVYVYIIFVINSVMNYFFIHYRSIVEANQEKYIITLVHYTCNIILLIVQAIVLILYKNFILYMIVQLISTIIENIVISIIAKKKYKNIFSINTSSIDKKEKIQIFKKTKSMSCQLIGNIVLNGTDNIVISAMAGINWVGLYSNYYLIISVIDSFTAQIFSAIQASIGNLNVIENEDKKYKIYKVLDFINFWIAAFCSISFGIIVNKFVQFWVGKEYVLSNFIVMVITINLYLQLANKVNTIYKYSTGIIEKDRYAPMIGVIINIILSIILTKILGVIGVFIGTTIALLCTQTFVEPYILYKYVFKKPFTSKVKNYIFRFIFTLIIGTVLFKIVTFIDIKNQILELITLVMLCIIIINIIIIFVYKNKTEFNFVYDIIKKNIKKEKM